MRGRHLEINDIIYPVESLMQHIHNNNSCGERKSRIPFDKKWKEGVLPIKLDMKGEEENIAGSPFCSCVRYLLSQWRRPTEIEVFIHRPWADDQSRPPSTYPNFFGMPLASEPITNVFARHPALDLPAQAYISWLATWCPIQFPETSSTCVAAAAMTTVNNQGSNGDQVAPRPTVDTTLANAIKLREERIGKKAGMYLQTETTVTTLDVVACMIEVETQMRELREALETSSNAEQKLFEYSRYDQLSYATKRLVNAIALVEGKTLTGLNSKEQADLLQSLQNARFLSASVGKNAVFTIGIMNRAAESNVGWNTAADHFNRLKELEKMLNHVTLATDTTWRGMDTVAKFASAIDTKPREIKVSLWQWVMWLVCMLTFGLMLFGLLYVDPLSKACSRVNVMRSLELQGHAMLYSVLKEQSEQLEINKIIFDTKVDAIHNKTELAFEHIRANEIRIDNIWEALGEPNVNGTYFTIGPEGTTMDVTAEDIRKFKAILEKVDMDIHKQLHNQLKDVNTKIEFSIQHLKNDLDAIKKEWQRADIRLSARLDRVERHRGAAIA